MEKVAGVVLLGLAIYYLYLSTEYPYVAGGIPGPGMLPRILGLVLLFLSLAYTIRSWLRAETKGAWGKDSYSVLACLALYLLYIISMQWLGFLVATLIFGLLALRYLFNLGWSLSLLYSFVLAVSFHVVFYNFFGVPLPRGLSWKILEILNIAQRG